MKLRIIYLKGAHHYAIQKKTFWGWKYIGYDNNLYREVLHAEWFDTLISAESAAKQYGRNIKILSVKEVGFEHI